MEDDQHSDLKWSLLLRWPIARQYFFRWSNRSVFLASFLDDFHRFFSFETGRISELRKNSQLEELHMRVSWNGSPKPWISRLKWYKMVHFGMIWGTFIGKPPYEYSSIIFHPITSQSRDGAWWTDPAMIINELTRGAAPELEKFWISPI